MWRMTSTEPPNLAATAASTPEACVNCGAVIATPFCATCGERRASDRQYTLVHFGHEVLENFTQFDGSVWRTLKTLVTRPGELTIAYMRGERIRFMKPLQLFALVSIVYFIVASAFDVRTFDTPLMYQLQGRAAQRARMVDARIAERKVSREEYTRRFDQTSTAQAKSLVIVMVPAFALLLGIVEYRKRRFAVHHLVFSVHAYTALLIAVMAVAIVGIPAVRAILPAGLGRGPVEVGLSFVLFAAMFAWLLKAIRHAYGDSGLTLVLKTTVLVAGMIEILFLYRALLFFTTLWAT